MQPTVLTATSYAVSAISILFHLFLERFVLADGDLWAAENSFKGGRLLLGLPLRLRAANCFVLRHHVCELLDDLFHDVVLYVKLDRLALQPFCALRFAYLLVGLVVLFDSGDPCFNSLAVF